MTELHLLNQIAEGRTTYARDEFFDFTEVDRMLRSFSETGYVEKIVRIVPEGHAVDSVVVIGGLTLLAERRRSYLQQLQRSKWAAIPTA